MHRVLNYGSSLQAFALYKTIKKLGHDCEIIDYQYPNQFHKDNSKERRNLKSELSFFLLRVRTFILYRGKKQRRRFVTFWQEQIKTSPYYASKNEIFKNPPLYDVYMTGSDQVWNPKCMKGDNVFFCDFVSNVKKVSYASSFSSSQIPDFYKETYINGLSTYSYISVRENSGLTIIKELINKEAKVVCDPTLLLMKDDYKDLANKSEINYKPPYILVYSLSYAYNPYPQMSEVIDNIKKQLNIPVVYLHVNSIDHYRIGSSITSAGPYEFLNLFMNASFVITSSFHGTAFALCFEKPFYAIVPSDSSSDSRIFSLLENVGAKQRAIYTNKRIEGKLPIDLEYTNITSKMDEIRRISLKYLKEMINC